MADMQVTVRFGRKAGHDPAVLARGQVVGDDLADKIQGREASGVAIVWVPFREMRSYTGKNVSKPGNNSRGGQFLCEVVLVRLELTDRQSLTRIVVAIAPECLTKIKNSR